MTFNIHAPSRRFMRLTVGLLMFAVTSGGALAEPSHGLAMRGDPALPADYKHFDYADPNAPKGGRIVYGVEGVFEDLNPFNLKAIRTDARGLWDPQFGNLIFETLMKRSRNEPFTLYGLIAQKVEVPDDRRWIEFHLDPRAKFSDGKPLTVDDVLFTFDLMRDDSIVRPPYSSRMKLVEKVEQTAERSIRITFNDEASRESPLLFALMPVLPKHATDVENYGKSSMNIPIGSGPYTITDLNPGQSLTYTRNPDYWAKDLPSQRGFFNFDTIKVDYFNGGTAQFEAFRKGLFDVYIEDSPARWQTAYDFAAVNDGRIAKDNFARTLPSGMLGLVFNTRRKKFSNRNVRKALAMMFDFEWTNENLFFNAYERTSSYWQESDLSALGRKASAGEAELLKPFAGAIEPEVMDGTYTAPVADGSGRDRKILRRALRLLQKEGYSLQDGTLIDPNGEQLQFEILIAGGVGISGRDLERLTLGYKRTVSRLGIAVQVRFVDDSQYQARKGDFDYDMTVVRYSSTVSPGSEQIFRWHSSSRDRPGTFNFAGTSDPAIDALIGHMLNAKAPEEFRDAVRAYDRLLISGHYVVPLYHKPQTNIARWVRIARPETHPLYGPQFPTWWHAEAGQ